MAVSLMSQSTGGKWRRRSRGSDVEVDFFFTSCRDISGGHGPTGQGGGRGCSPDNYHYSCNHRVTLWCRGFCMFVHFLLIIFISLLVYCDDVITLSMIMTNILNFFSAFFAHLQNVLKYPGSEWNYLNKSYDSRLPPVIPSYLLCLLV